MAKVDSNDGLKSAFPALRGSLACRIAFDSGACRADLAHFDLAHLDLAMGEIEMGEIEMRAA